MNLEQYAAQQAQKTQQAPQVPTAPQAPQPLDIVAAQLDAEKHHALLAHLDKAIKEGGRPADVLQSLTVAAFGEGSPQATTLKAAIDAETCPGGHELAIASIRRQKAAIRAAQKKLTEQGKALADELARLDESEQDITRDKVEAGGIDRALLDVMQLCTAPEPPTLHALAELFHKHKGRRAAMGLFYGMLEDMTRKDAGRLDMVDYQSLLELKKQVLEAVTA